MGWFFFAQAPTDDDIKNQKTYEKPPKSGSFEDAITSEYIEAIIDALLLIRDVHPDPKKVDERIEKLQSILELYQI